MQDKVTDNDVSPTEGLQVDIELSSIVNALLDDYAAVLEDREAVLPHYEEQLLQLISTQVHRARIEGIKEAKKEIMSIAYTYTGEDELSDFCGVDDLSRVSTSWMFSRIKELEDSLG
jgi:hypothetical protein